ncbi:TPA: hypothetical protein ACGO97_001557 [Streptococcus suis]
MKKLIYLLTLITMLVLGFIGFKLIHYHHASIDLKENAAFYIIYPDKIESFQLIKGVPSLTSTQDMGNEHYFGRGRNSILQDRYLMFSNNQAKSFSENIVSLDFQEGKISRSPSKYFSYINGSDQDYFYTLSANRLTAFDTNGNEVKHLELPKNFMSKPNIMTDRGDFLVVAGEEIVIDHPELAKNFLYIINKKEFKLTDKVEYDYSYRTYAGLMKNGMVYQPISTYYYGDEQQDISYDLLRFNPVSKEVDIINLSNPTPYQIHDLQSDKFILIEHDSYISQYPHFTLYDTETGQESYHPFPHLTLPYGSSFMVQLLDAEQLLFIYGDQLLVYNFKTSTIVSQTSLSAEYISGLWVNQK